MGLDLNTEKWNEICFLLSENVKKDISENAFEQHVVQALMVLEWKMFSGDYDIRPSIPIGASNRITPDFVVNSSDKKKLFVIEIKQPNIPITLNFQQQLFSYMRQLKLEYGLLIGQSIQIFYDGPLARQDDPVLLDTITFERNSEKGKKFTELFNKGGFDKDKLKDFTIISLENINRELESRNLFKTVTAESYRETIKNMIKQDLISKYDEKVIDQMLNKLNITISFSQDGIDQQVNLKETPLNKVIHHNKPMVQKYIRNGNSKDHSRYIFNGQEFGKGRLVLAVIKDYVRNNPAISYNELKTKFPDNLQGTETFTTIEHAIGKRDRRNFLKEDELIPLIDETIAVSTEWGAHNIGRFLKQCEKLGIEIEIGIIKN